VTRDVTRYLTASAAAILLLVAATSATARSLSLSSQTKGITWSNLEFTNSFGFGTIRCAFTLEGSFHARTIAKVINSLIGAITAAEAAACTGGEVIPRRETLPWHAQYGGFAGTLPNITSITLTLSRLRFGFRGITCEAEYGDGDDILRERITREPGGGLTSATISTNDRLDAIRTSGSCPTRIGLRGVSSRFTALNSASRITLTLI
jgi:hypothetical protein